MPRRIVEQPEEEEEEQVDPNEEPAEEEGDPTAEEEPVEDEEAEEQPYRRPVRKAVAAPRAEPTYSTVAEDTFKALVAEVLDARLTPLFTKIARLQKGLSALEGVIEKGLVNAEPVEKSNVPSPDPAPVATIEPAAPAAAPSGTAEQPAGKVVVLKSEEEGLEPRAASALRKATDLTVQHRRGFQRRGAVDAAMRGGYLNEALVKSLENEIAEVEDLVVKGLL